MCRGGVTEKTFDEEIEEIEDDPLAMATIPPVGGPTPFKEGDDYGIRVLVLRQLAAKASELL